jgi:flagellar basal body-associated protein FliL
VAADAKTDIPEIGDLKPSTEGEKKSQTAGVGKFKGMAVQAGIFIAIAGAAFGLNIYVLKPMLITPGKEDVKAEAVKAKEEHHPGKILALDPAIVNIAGTNGRRYLKVTIQIEVPEEEKLIKEVEARKPLLSDRLIQILAGKSLEEVTGAGSLQALKQQISDQFGEALGAERLKEVYLTEFVIQ